MMMRWQGRDPWADILAMVSATFSQNAFRFREDDGSETAATWIANENVDVTDFDVTNDHRLRVRIAVQETAGGSTNNFDVTLQFRVNGGAWTNVNGSTSHVVFVSSSFVANQANTTDQLTTPTGTFRSGAFVSDSDSAARISFSGNDHGENEYSLNLLANDLSDGDVIEFRLLGDNSVLADYSQTPSITVSATPSGSFAASDAVGVTWNGFAEFIPPTSSTYEATDQASVAWTGAMPGMWLEPAEFTGITQTFYDDSDIDNGEWYRYRVAEVKEGTTGTFTEWVIGQAPEITQGTFSATDSATVTWQGLAPAVAPAEGIFAVTDSANAFFIGARDSTGAISAASDAVSVGFVGDAPTVPAAEGTFAVVDISSVGFVGDAPAVPGAFGVFPAPDAASVAWTGASLPVGAFAVSDSASVAWTGAHLPVGAFPASGTASVAWTGAHLPVGAFPASDAASVTWAGSSLPVSTYEISDVVTSRYTGLAPTVDGAQGSFWVTDAASVGWSAIADRAAAFAVSVTTSVTWSGEAPVVPGAGGAFAALDVTNVPWTGAHDPAGAFPAPDSAPVAWVGAHAPVGAFPAADGALVTWFGNAPTVGAADGTFAAPDAASVGWASDRDSAGAYAVSEQASVAWTGARLPVGTYAISDQASVGYAATRDAVATHEVADVVGVEWNGDSSEGNLFLVRDRTNVEFAGTKYQLKMTWNTNLGDGTTRIHLALAGDDINCLVDWGDGTPVEHVTNEGHQHQYASHGTYEVSVKGVASGYDSFSEGGGINRRRKLIAVSEFLSSFTNLTSAFEECENLATVSGGENLGNVESFALAFSGCINLQSVSALDVSGSTTFSNMFANCGSLEAAPLQGTRHDISYAQTALGTPAIIDVFEGLGNLVGSDPATIDITGTPGAELSDPQRAIAENKNWTIQGAVYPLHVGTFDVDDSAVAGWAGSSPTHGIFEVSDSASVAWDGLSPFIPFTHGVFPASDSATVEAHVEVLIFGTFGASDNVTVGWDGFTPGAWDELTEFNVVGTMFDDDTVLLGNWYRYRVAVASSGQAVTEYSEWVQEESPPSGFGSFEITATDSVAWLPNRVAVGEYPVTDTVTFAWTTYVGVASFFEASDSATVGWEAFTTASADYLVPDEVTVTWTGDAEKFSEYEVTDTVTVDWEATREATSVYGIVDRTFVRWTTLAFRNIDVTIQPPRTRLDMDEGRIVRITFDTPSVDLEVSEARLDLIVHEARL